MSRQKCMLAYTEPQISKREARKRCINCEFLLVVDTCSVHRLPGVKLGGAPITHIPICVIYEKACGCECELD